MDKIVASLGSFPSSAQAAQRILHTFSGRWGSGDIFEWYRTLVDPPARSIQKIQIWRDFGAVPHRFIVLHMSNGQTHRFDRRPSHGVEMNHVRLVANYSMPSEDACELNIDYEHVTRNAECEIELALRGEIDIMIVLSACHIISSDSVAREYSLFRYNCFFFSWTILMVTSRRYLPYEAPRPESVIPRFRSELNRVTEFIVEEIITYCLDLVIETITILRAKTGSRLNGGFHPITRIAWTLPTRIFQIMVRKLFKLRLRYGLRSALSKKVREELGKLADLVQKAALPNHCAGDTLNKHLWIEDVEGLIKRALETETMKLIWASILEATSAGLGGLQPEELSAVASSSNLKFSLLGRNVAQLSAVWNAALYCGLEAAKKASQNTTYTTHEAAFKDAWYAARDASLHAGQAVVDNTSKAMNNSKRDEMWRQVWDIWEDCWDATHAVVQPRSVEMMNKIVDKVLAAGVVAVIQDMKDSRVKTIQARTLAEDQSWFPSALVDLQSEANITNAELQVFMLKMIEKGTINAETVKEVHVTMARIWANHSDFISQATEFVAIEEKVGS